MKIIHNIKISVLFLNSEEEQIENALLKLLPKQTKKDLENKKNEIIKENVSDESNLIMYKLKIVKNKQCNLFFENLINNLEDESIIEKIKKRIDEKCKLFIRLKKDELIKNNYKLTYCGDCFHIKMTIASYPKKQKIAEELITKKIKEIKN